MKLTILSFVAVLLTASPSDSQMTASAGARCRDASTRALDFWIGHWEVRNPAGQRIASSEIDLVADGCAILERYTGVPGPAGNQYIGAGLHVFDATENGWRQLWSDNRPGVTVMKGTQTGTDVVYEWDVVNPQGRRIPKRYTLSSISTNWHGPAVRQLGERSDDGGQTWTVEFDLRYTRREP